VTPQLQLSGLIAENLGLLLRHKSVHNVNVGSTWKISLLFSLVQELVPLWSSEDSFDWSEAAKCITAYNKFVSRIEELGLSDIGDAKPILDGKEIVNLLEAKPGPWTGQVLSKVIEWQLEHSHGTKEECSKWLLSEAGQGRIITTSSHSTQKRVKNGADTSPKKIKR